MPSTAWVSDLYCWAFPSTPPSHPTGKEQQLGPGFLLALSQTPVGLSGRPVLATRSQLTGTAGGSGYMSL